MCESNNYFVKSSIYFLLIEIPNHLMVDKQSSLNTPLIDSMSPIRTSDSADVIQSFRSVNSALLVNQESTIFNDKEVPLLDISEKIACEKLELDQEMPSGEQDTFLEFSSSLVKFKQDLRKKEEAKKEEAKKEAATEAASAQRIDTQQSVLSNQPNVEKKTEINPKSEVDEKSDGTEIIKKLIDRDSNYFQITRPFEKAQYHQCIPNPQKQGEQITVQLITPKLEAADPTHSLDEMTKVDAKLPNTYYQRYSTTSFGRLDKRLDAGFKSALTSKFGMQNNVMIEQDVSQVGKKDDADEVKIEHVIPMKKDKPTISKNGAETMKIGVEVAIIAFWKLYDNGEFKCYHYFYVQNPMKREARRSDRKEWDRKQSTVSVQTLLFNGHNGDIFFFFNTSKEPKNLKTLEFKMGVLNLTGPPQKDDNLDYRHHQNPLNVKEIFVISDLLATTFIRQLDKPVHQATHKLCQNPYLIRDFVPAPKNDKASGEKNYVLVFPTLSKGKKLTNDLIFYELGTKTSTIVKKIIGAEVFLSHNKAENKVVFLSNKFNTKLEHRASFVISEKSPLFQSMKSTKHSTGQMRKMFQQSNRATQVFPSSTHKNAKDQFFSPLEVAEGEDKGEQFAKLQQLPLTKRTSRPSISLYEPAKKENERGLEQPEQIVYLTLNKEVDQDPYHSNDDDINIIKLNYRNVDQKFSTNKQSKILDAFLHNGGTRMTYIRRGMCSYTFQLPEEDDTPQALLIYYIEDDEIASLNHSMEDADDLYIRTGIRVKPDQSTIYSEAEQVLYNVSEVITDDGSQRTNHEDQDNQLKPKTVKTLKFLINQSFKQALETEGNNLCYCLPVWICGPKKLEIDSEEPDIMDQLMNVKVKERKLSIQSRPSVSLDQDFDKKSNKSEYLNAKTKLSEDVKVFGSLIYEEIGTGELILTFYNSTLNTREDSTGDKSSNYPQHPLQQTWRIDYPLLAYKSMVPDNREIVLIHLGHNIPQRIIDLGSWEFVSFVQGAFDRKDITKQIIFLVRHTSTQEKKLIIIKADPWKEINRSLPFDLPENIFVVEGDVAQPPKTAQKREYSDDKIRSVQIMSTQINTGTQNVTLAALVIQFEHCIATSSIKSKVFKIRCEPSKMVREYQIRGSHETVFFAQKNLDRSTIQKLEFHQKSSEKIMKTQVYELNSRLVAMERDDDPVNFQSNRPSLFLLGQDLRVHQIKHSLKSDQYECTKIFDFTEHQMSALVDLDWSQCHISDQSVTYDEVTFQVNSDHPSAKNGSKAYFWYDKLHLDQRHHEKEQIKKAKDELDFEKLQIQVLNETSGMLVVGTCGKKPGQQYTLGQYFMLRPSPSSRRTHLISFEQAHMIKHQTFVTNNHILIQFESKHTSKKDANGRVIEPTELSDECKIEGQMWKTIKEEAMKDDTYRKHKWYEQLNSTEKQLLEALRTAQKEQKDMAVLIKKQFTVKSTQPQTVVLEANGSIIEQSPAVLEYLNADIIGESEIIDGSKHVITQIDTDTKHPKTVFLHFTLTGKAYVRSVIPHFLQELSKRITIEEKQQQFKPMTELRDKQVKFQLDQEKKKDTQNSLHILALETKLTEAKENKNDALTKSTEAELKEEKKKPESKASKISSWLDHVKRRELMAKSLKFASKILIVNGSEIVTVSRVLQPENEGQHKLKQEPKKLSDDTIIAGSSWRDLKEKAMSDKYKDQAWFKTLKPTDQHLLERLRTAQGVQEDLLELVHEAEASDADIEANLFKSETTDGMSVTSVVFTHEQEEFIDTDNKLEPDNLLKKMSYQLVGPYLCYKKQGDGKIRYRKILKGDDEDKIGDIGPERCIDLSTMIKKNKKEFKEEMQYVTFAAISKTSIQTIQGGSAQNPSFFKSLIEVVLRNSTYIFDLDGKSHDKVGWPWLKKQWNRVVGNPPRQEEERTKQTLKEINFMEEIDQLIQPDSFIQYGTSQKIIQKVVEKKGQTAFIRLNTNQQGSLYFKESRQMHFAGDRSMKFKLIANKEGKKKEQEIVQKKFYNMEYSGILYRTLVLKSA